MTKESILYKFLKYTLPITLRIFYKKVVVTGYKNIPRKGPVIFACDHQNALIDALIVGNASFRGTYFLARADIFKKPFIAKLLGKIRIFPVFRIRDGVENLDNNNDTFNKCISLLGNAESFTIFPEGSHNRMRHLRELKKGIARIAFEAETKNKKNLVVIPVGLNYSNHIYCNSEVVVNFGKPINVSEYMDLYSENSAKALHNFMLLLSSKIKELMINIEDVDNYTEIEQIREIYDTDFINKLSCKERNKADIEFINKINNLKAANNQLYSEIIDTSKKYCALKTELNVKEYCLSKKFSIIFNSILMVMLSPLYIIMVINNFIPYIIIKKFLKSIKDDHFYATFKFAIGMFLFPIMYIISFALFWIISGNTILALIYIAVVLLSSLIILRTKFLPGKIKDYNHFRSLVKQQPEKVNQMINLRKEIIRYIKCII